VDGAVNYEIEPPAQGASKYEIEPPSAGDMHGPYWDQAKSEVKQWGQSLARIPVIGPAFANAPKNIFRTAIEPTYPYRIGHLLYDTFTGKQKPDEASGIVEDAIRDFALSEGFNGELGGKPPVRPQPPAPPAEPPTTGPREMWGQRIPPPAPTGPPEMWGQRIPEQPPAVGHLLRDKPAPPTVRRGPGEIAPEITRPQRGAFSPIAPGEPIPTRRGIIAPAQAIPSRQGLQLPGKVEPSAALGEIPVAPPEPQAAALGRPTRAANRPLQAQLEDSLGSPKVDVKPGVKMRDQIPRGHVPAESSAIDSYHYDPEKQELSVKSKGGTTYTHGEVTPEEAQNFANSESKGKAWNDIRANHVLVKKNGTPVKPRIAPEDLGPMVRQGPIPAETRAEELQPQLEKSLEQAKAKKAEAPIRSKADIDKDIDELTAKGEARRQAATDQSIRGLRPAGTDWMSEDELGKLNQLQGERHPYTAEENSPELAKQRVAEKRAARMAANEAAARKAEAPIAAPEEDLQGKLQTMLDKVNEIKGTAPIAPAKAEKSAPQFAVGDRVRSPEHNADGTVTRVMKSNAEVMLDNGRKVPVKQKMIRKLEAPGEIGKTEEIGQGQEPEKPYARDSKGRPAPDWQTKLIERTSKPAGTEEITKPKDLKESIADLEARRATDPKADALIKELDRAFEQKRGGLTEAQEAVRRYANGAPGESAADFDKLFRTKSGPALRKNVVAEAQKRGTPTDDAFAEALWKWSNKSDVPHDFAAMTMRDAGYEAHKGFPLTRRSADEMAAQRARLSSTADKSATIPTEEDLGRGQAARSGNQGKGAEIPEAPARSRETGPGAQGATTTVKVPGESQTYRATYQVRELADIQPSHSGETFQPNPKYKLTNDRDYTNQANQGKVLMNAGGDFEPAYHLTDNPDATNGPVIVDSQGNALGGNGRTMILQRVYKFNPEGAQAYKDMLWKKAEQFGIRPSAIQNMKQPVLVREIPDSELPSVADKQKAVTDFNKKGTAELTPSERAIADSNRLSPETLDYLAAKIDEIGPDASLANVLSSPSGPKILDRLIQDGALTPQERAAFVTERGLTQAGKDRLSKLMVGRFFEDPAQLENAAPSMVQKLEKLSAPLARIEQGSDWDLTVTVRQAVRIIEDMKTHNMTIDDLVRQQGLFGGGAHYSAEAIAMAEQLKDTPANTLAKVAKRYAQDADAARTGLLIGEPIGQEQAFKEAFGNSH
jgi:hypothetical protein